MFDGYCFQEGIPELRCKITEFSPNYLKNKQKYDFLTKRETFFLRLWTSLRTESLCKASVSEKTKCRGNYSIDASLALRSSSSI